MFAFLKLFGLLSFFHAGFVSGTALKVGVGFATGSFEPIAVESRHACEMFREHVQAHGIGDSGITDIEFEFHDVERNKTLTTEVFADMASRLDFLIAPYSSSLTPNAALEVDKAGRGGVLFAGGAAAPSVYECTPETSANSGCDGRTSGRRFTSIYGTFNTAPNYMKPFVTISKIKQTETIAFFTESASFTSSICDGAIHTAKENKLQNLLNKTISKMTNKPENAEKETAELRDLIRKLKELDPDSVVGCTYTGTCASFLEIAKEENWIPKSLALSACVGSPVFEAAAGSKSDYIMGSTQWAADLKGAYFTEGPTHPVGMFIATPSEPSPERFRKLFAAKAGHNPTYQAASFMASLYTMYLGIALSSSTNPTVVRDTLDRLDMPSFYGRLAFNRFGVNTLKPMATQQYVKTRYDAKPTLSIVAPLSAANVDVIYPVPPWTDRLVNRYPYSTSAEQAVVGLSAFGLVIAFGTMGTMTFFRDANVIQAISFKLSSMILVGISFCLVSMLFPVDATNIKCAMNPFLLPMGISAIISGLLCKLFRIHRVLNQLKQTTEQQMLKLWAGLMTVQLAISIITIAAAPSQAETQEIDVLRPTTFYDICVPTSAITMQAVSVLQYIFLGLITAAVLALSYLTRNVFSEFNESTRLSNVVYLTVFSTAMILVAGTRTEAEVSLSTHLTKYTLQSAGVVCIAVMDMIIMFLMPIIYCIQNKSAEDVRPKTLKAFKSKTGLVSLKGSKVSASKASVTRD